MANAGKDGNGHMADNSSKYKIHIGGSGLDDENANKVIRDVFEEEGISGFIDDSGKSKNS